MMITAFVANGILTPQEVTRQRLLGPNPNDGKEMVTLKWHLTLINTKQRKESAAAAASNAGADSKSDSKKKDVPYRTPRTPFDATPLLKQFPALDFGTEPAPFLHLAARGAPDASGGYKCVLALPL
jgi:hypothetical protein